MCYLFTLKHLGPDMVLSLQRGKLVKNQTGSQLTSSTRLAGSENISKEKGKGEEEVEMRREQISCFPTLFLLKLQMTSGIKIGN